MSRWFSFTTSKGLHHMNAEKVGHVALHDDGWVSVAIGGATACFEPPDGKIFLDAWAEAKKQAVIDGIRALDA